MIQRQFKYYDFIMAAFCTVLICANFIGAGKISTVEILGHPFTFGAAVIFFPISYIFGDILTEVYGFARSRRVVWAGMGAQLFTSLMATSVVALPPSPDWPHQGAYEIAYGQAPRIVFASMAAYFFGEFVNSAVLAKMKIWTKGKYLWARTIGSTLVGELMDSVLFYPLAFLGVWSTEQVIQVLVSNYLLKVFIEILFTPVTYRVVDFLKKVEREDYYDKNTKFTPFSFELK